MAQKNSHWGVLLAAIGFATTWMTAPAPAAKEQPSVDCRAELARIESLLTRVKLDRNAAQAYTVLRRKALSEIASNDAACVLTLKEIKRVLSIDTTAR